MRLHGKIQNPGCSRRVNLLCYSVNGLAIFDMPEKIVGGDARMALLSIERHGVIEWSALKTTR